MYIQNTADLWAFRVICDLGTPTSRDTESQCNKYVHVFGRKVYTNIIIKVNNGSVCFQHVIFTSCFIFWLHGILRMYLWFKHSVMEEQ